MSVSRRNKFKLIFMSFNRLSESTDITFINEPRLRLVSASESDQPSSSSFQIDCLSHHCNILSSVDGDGISPLTFWQHQVWWDDEKVIGHFSRSTGAASRSERF